MAVASSRCGLFLNDADFVFFRIILSNLSPGEYDVVIAHSLMGKDLMFASFMKKFQ